MVSIDVALLTYCTQHCVHKLFGLGTCMCTCTTTLFTFTDDCGNGDIRLVNGETKIEGRVEICLYLRWGTVCDSQWTDKPTAVVCGYLGFSDIIGGM